MVTVENGLKIARKMMKQLLVTGAVILVSMLIIQFNRSFGILLMMGYSSWMMVKGSRHDMVLGKFTALLPGVMSLVCFLVLLVFLGVHRPIMPLIGIGLGIIPGFLKARGHRIYNKDGKVFAQKTYFYILIWTGSLLFTQGATLLGLRQIAEFGFLLNGFSTTMAVILSVFLFIKVRPPQNPQVASVHVVNMLLPAFLVIVSMLMFGTGTLADTTFSAGNANSLGTYSGIPPAGRGSGVRYGKTEYQAMLNPGIAQALNGNLKKWFVDKNYKNQRKALLSWSFSGGRLVVDWDTKNAILEPLKFSYIWVYEEHPKNPRDKIRRSYYSSSDVSSLKNKQSGGNGLNMLGVTTGGGGSANNRLNVEHGFGQTVIIGPGHLDMTYTSMNAIDEQGRYLRKPSFSTIGSTQFKIYNSFNNSSDRERYNQPVSADNFLLQNEKNSNGHFYQRIALAGGRFGANCFVSVNNALSLIRRGDRGTEFYSSGWANDVIFTPVKSVGRAPASPHLLSERRPQFTGWDKKKLKGTYTYTCRSLNAVPSPADRNTTTDVYTGLRNTICQDAELQVNWDTRKATLSPFSIQWQLPVPKWKQNNSTTEIFNPVKNSIGKIAFNGAGFRNIVGGKLTYNWQNKHSSGNVATMNPVTFRGKPVQVEWQAIPWANGAILVRVYARPSAIKASSVYSSYQLPAYYDIVFEKTKKSGDLFSGGTGTKPSSQKSTTSQQSNSSSTSSPQNQQNTGMGTTSLAGPDSDDPTSPTDQDNGVVSGVEQFLNSIEQSLQNVGFSEQAAAAGVAVALVQILAGLGMGAANSAAFEVASAVQEGVNQSIHEDSGSSPQLGPDGLLDENGEPWQPNEDGLFGLENDDGGIDWMTREEAEDSIQEELDRRDKQAQESDALWDDIQQDANAWMDQKGQEGLQSQQAMADKLAAEKAAQEQQAQKQAELLEKLDKISKDGYTNSEDLIAGMKKDGDWAGLQQVYHDRLEDLVRDSAAERDENVAEANGYWVGEKFFQGTKAASKGALMVLGGPAGWAATGTAVGAISAAEEGAEAQLRGDSLGGVLAHSAGGFVSGFKDGALSVYVNMPGTSKLTQVLLPAGTDAVEMYIRTGDGSQALTAAGYSIAGDLAGMGTDKIGGRVTKEFAEAGTTAVMSGTQSYTGGGNFMDGVGNGLLNHAGGKLGGASGGHALTSGLVSPDQKIKQTMAEAYVDANHPIKTEDLPDNIQKLNDTRYTETDADGNQKEYVDTKQALDQLADTQGSRDVKHAADKSLTEAMIRTRDDKIYGPPNEATLNAVKNSSDPDTQAWLDKNMQEGDILAMDNFSTPGPGKGVSLGADRDVRMVVKHYDPETGDYIKTFVPLEYWGDQGRKDYFDHGEKIYAEAGLDLKTEIQKGIDSGEGIYADRDKTLGHLKQPELSDQQLDKMRDDRRSRMNKQNEIKQTMYGNKVSPDEMNKMTRTPEQIDVEVEKSIDRIKRQGLTNDQILHHTYSQANNQLLTDKFHMEASRANSDQGFNEIRNQGVERTEVRANVLEAKDGKQRLEDPEGFGRMWDEKSHFYHGQPAEALAQSKKGISEMISLRDGQRTQGLNPAAFKPETAQAMEVIIQAPTGSSATPEAMAQVNQQIQSIRDDKGHQVYKDMNDAMSKVGRSVEYNKWTPANRTGLSGSEASRLARLEQEREWARRLKAEGGN